PWGWQISIHRREERSAGEETCGEQSKKEHEQSGKHPRQESKEAGNVLLKADNFQYADPHQDETQPCHPEDEAAEQFCRGGERELLQHFGSPRMLGKAVKPGKPQDAAQNSLQNVGNNKPHEDDDQHHQQTRKETRKTSRDLVHRLRQLIQNYFSHRHLTYLHSTVPAGTALILETSQIDSRRCFPRCSPHYRGSRSENNRR